MEGRFDTDQTDDQKAAPDRSKVARVRHWRLDDIPLIAVWGVAMRFSSPFFDAQHETTTEDGAKWLHKIYPEELSMVFIAENEYGETLGVCGVSVTPHFFPPHFPIGFEWCLFGSHKRAIASVWKEAKRWAKQRAALFITRSTFNGQRETVNWEKL